MFEKVVQDGVVLKPLEPWHAGEFAEHMNRARDHIRPWVGPTLSPTPSRVPAQRFSVTPQPLRTTGRASMDSGTKAGSSEA